MLDAARGIATRDAALRDALQSHRLAQIVAKDPVAAVEAFHRHVLTCSNDLRGATIEPGQLHLDGGATRGLARP